MKEKRAVNTTPKKTVADSIECQAASPPVPDLRLEAKMSAQVSHHAQFDSRVRLILLDFGNWICLCLSLWLLLTHTMNK